MFTNSGQSPFHMRQDCSIVFGFFGQLITQPRCMPKSELQCIITGLQNFAALPLAKPGERARPGLPEISNESNASS